MTTKDILVCNCCQKDRKRSGKDPRVRVPVFYSDKVAPVLLCEYCDGDSLKLARRIEEPPPSGD